MEARTLLALAAILAVASTAAATTHIVGGTTGWTIPPNATFYSVWASSQVITPGDSLVFNFAKGAHDVAKVPKASYDACTTTSQLGSTLNNAPATVTVAAGTHYYICAVPGHCSAGQKLAVTVAALAKGPAVSAPAPAVAPSVAPKASPVPAAAPGVAVPTASTPSLSPAAATAAGSTADTPTAAAGPSNGSNSATELRSAAGAAVAVLAVAAASLLI